MKSTAPSDPRANTDYARDPLGRTCKTVINGVTTYSIYDGWNLIMHYTSTGTVSDRITYGRQIDEVLTRTVGSTVYYYQYDGTGSVVRVLFSNGDPAETYTYDTDGRRTIYAPDGSLRTSTAIGNRYLFHGHEYLQQIGLYDFRNRIYNADLGRFMEPDPLGFGAGDENLYRFCGNDPVNKSDPMGTDTSVSERIATFGATHVGTYLPDRQIHTIYTDLTFKDFYENNGFSGHAYTETGGGFLTANANGSYSATYALRGQAVSQWIFPINHSRNLNDYQEGFVNGILGSYEGMQLRADQSGKPGFFNESHGFFADVFEAFTEKAFSFAGDPLAAKMAGGMRGLTHSFSITAHSQGALIVLMQQNFTAPFLPGRHST